MTTCPAPRSTPWPGNCRPKRSADLLRIGDCGLRDPDSRVAAVTIDQMFHVLQRAAQTNPKLKAIDWANPVPADPRDWDINPEALLRVRTNIAAVAAHADAGAEPDDVTTGYQDDDDVEDLPVDEHLEADPATDGADRDWTEAPADVGSR